MNVGADILVDGVCISAHDVRVEAQYHPAASFEHAEHQARRALVVRELLRQRCQRAGGLPSTQTEDGLQAAIEELMEREVPVPPVDEDECRRYYEENPQRFRSPDLYEAAHILIAIGPEDADRVQEIELEAERILDELRVRPEAFEDLARRRSACPSALQGGNLGQSLRGDMAAQLEGALESLEPGQIGPSIVRTKHGLHVVKLLARQRGQRMPFEAVQPRILLYLRDAAWRLAVAAFLRSLAEQAEIRGFDFDEPIPERRAEVVARRVRLPVVAAEQSAPSRGPAVRPLNVLA